jgi:carbamoyl-phosphate synthase small subunit
VTGPPALLVLEDGIVFRGTGFGAEGEAFGEAVFNTGMAGYQEVLTDPSYAGQIVVMTSPHQGNYGVNAEDAESDRIHVAGFAVRENARRASSWRAEGTLAAALAAAGVPGIEGIDTRKLTRRIRDAGAMRAGVSTTDPDPASLLERIRAAPRMVGADLASTVTTPAPYEAATVVGPADRSQGRVFRVVAYDFGIKRSILSKLAARGIEATVVPSSTPAGEVAAAVDAGGVDGVLLSNGPGDPAATADGVAAAAGLLGRVPLFGICLGHQLLALALEGRTYKMPFGHRGVNQPVRDERTGGVRITSHNHGFAVDPDGWRRRGDGAARTPVGAVEITHRNLNDGTVEGLWCRDVPAFSVQFHPEAAPGPHDADGLFEGFRALMAGA